MIQTEYEKEACEIVIDAMREMQKVLHVELEMYQTKVYYENTTTELALSMFQTKVACANTIAELAKSIDGKKHFLFGDVNTEKIVD